jgi:hypothetical protein
MRDACSRRTRSWMSSELVSATHVDEPNAPYLEWVKHEAQAGASRRHDGLLEVALAAWWNVLHRAPDAGCVVCRHYRRSYGNVLGVVSGCDGVGLKNIACAWCLSGASSPLRSGCMSLCYRMMNI